MNYIRIELRESFVIYYGQGEISVAGHSSRAIYGMNCLRSDAGIVGSNLT
jgi:hypothetical protein